MILSITGPSGVGKTTLLHNLLRGLPHAKPLTSVTTRTPRPTDEPGEYEYIDAEEFERIKNSGEFLWEARTTNNRYGTRKTSVDAALASDDQYIPILVLSAAKTLHEYARRNDAADRVRFIYIEIEDEAELRRRFKERGDAPEEVEARILECRTWGDEARRLDIPFVYLSGSLSREELCASTLQSLQS
jgi:guanylate kinase